MKDKRNLSTIILSLALNISVFLYTSCNSAAITPKFLGKWQSKTSTFTFLAGDKGYVKTQERKDSFAFTFRIFGDSILKIFSFKTYKGVVVGSEIKYRVLVFDQNNLSLFDSHDNDTIKFIRINYSSSDKTYNDLISKTSKKKETTMSQENKFVGVWFDPSYVRAKGSNYNFDVITILPEGDGLIVYRSKLFTPENYNWSTGKMEYERTMTTTDGSFQETTIANENNFLEIKTMGVVLKISQIDDGKKLLLDNIQFIRWDDPNYIEKKKPESK